MTNDLRLSVRTRDRVVLAELADRVVFGELKSTLGFLHLTTVSQEQGDRRDQPADGTIAHADRRRRAAAVRRAMITPGNKEGHIPTRKREREGSDEIK